jgi:hypothetical protein
MLAKKRGHIALISVHADPAMIEANGIASVQSAYIKKLGEGLAQAGWQVDMFTRRTDAEQLSEVEHCEGCRTIRLDAGPQTIIEADELADCLPDFLKAFVQHQSRTGILYPIVHTNYWLSGWVGLELQKKQLLKLVHTHHVLGSDRYQHSTTVPMVASIQISTEKACTELADSIVSIHPSQDGIQSSTEQGAATVEELDELYLTLLGQLHREFFAEQPVG